MDLNKDFIEKLQKVQGKVRGATFKFDYQYINNIIGKDTANSIEKKAKEFGLELDYKNINTMSWYPVKMRFISMILIAKQLDFDMVKIKDYGKYGPKLDVLIKYSAKFTNDLNLVAKHGSIFWRQHYDFGKLTVTKATEDPGYFSFILEDFIDNFDELGEEFLKIYAMFLEGYMEQIIQFIRQTSTSTINLKTNEDNKKIYELVTTW